MLDVSFSKSHTGQASENPLFSYLSVKRLADIEHRYDLYLVDIWGVLYDGTAPIDEAIRAVKMLRTRGKKVVLLSNTSRRSNALQLFLSRIGIDNACYDHAVSAGQIAYDAIAGAHSRYNGPCLVLGTQPEDDWRHDLGERLVQKVDDAQFLLAIGLLPHQKAPALDLILAQALRRNLPLICGNPDIDVVISGRRHRTAGSVAQLYAANGGQVEMCGKPEPTVYQKCFDLVPLATPAMTLAIGDTPATDIAGATKAGIATVLIADDGKNRDEAHGQRHRPVNSLTAYSTVPDILMHSLRW